MSVLNSSTFLATIGEYHTILLVVGFLGLFFAAFACLLFYVLKLIEWEDLDNADDDCYGE